MTVVTGETYLAVLRCATGCPGDVAVDTPVYRCQACGGLLEVVHDLEALGRRSADEWKRLFEARYRGQVKPYSSGVWGKKEWVSPGLPDEHIVSLDEGSTSLLRLERLCRDVGVEDVRVKLCGNSHTGSFKDLGMTVLVSVVRASIANGRYVRAVACASTGDTSAALAAYAAAADIPAIVLLPRGKVSVAQLVQPLANGALVLALDTDFDGCMAMVQRLATDEGLYLANSMNSLRLEGQKTIAFEIAQQLGWEVPDVLVVPGGNLGNVSAIAAGFDMLLALGLVARRPRLVVAQAAAANPLYRAYLDGWRFEPVTAQPTMASAIRIGNPVSVDKAIRALKRFDGIVEQASEAELADASALADRSGLFTCPHTGVALAALQKLVARGAIRRGERVVVISTASGLKFADVKAAYHAGRIEGLRSAHANTVVELPNEYDAIRRAIDRGLRPGRAS
jgi:threonine synthase